MSIHCPFWADLSVRRSYHAGRMLVATVLVAAQCLAYVRGPVGEVKKKKRKLTKTLAFSHGRCALDLWAAVFLQVPSSPASRRHKDAPMNLPSRSRRLSGDFGAVAVDSLFEGKNWPKCSRAPCVHRNSRPRLRSFPFQSCAANLRPVPCLPSGWPWP